MTGPQYMGRRRGAVVVVGAGLAQAAEGEPSFEHGWVALALGLEDGDVGAVVMPIDVAGSVIAALWEYASRTGQTDALRAAVDQSEKHMRNIPRRGVG